MGMLTQSRVERLIADLSGRVRAETAAIVAGEFASGHLNDTDQRIARDIIAVLARDVEIQVRESVAEHLKSCPFLPREVALELAYDIELVAAPILQFCYALTDEDLIAIVRIGSTIKQVAIARRRDVRAAVTDALVETGSRTVIGAVLENGTAAMSENALSAVVADLGHDEAIQALLVERPELPVTVVQGLIRHVSDELAARLVLKHRIPAQLAGQLLGQGREGAIARLIARGDGAAEISTDTVVRIKELITPTLLLRCLCQGSMRFVELALAALAGIPVESAAKLVCDPGPLGLPSLYGKAGLPPPLLRAFRAAVSANLESREKIRKSPAAELTRDILDRLTREYREISPGNLEHVLAELDRIARKGESPSAAMGIH